MSKLQERRLIETLSQGVNITVIEAGMALGGYSPHVRDMGGLRQHGGLNGFSLREMVGQAFKRQSLPPPQDHNKERTRLKKERVARLWAQHQGGMSLEELGAQEGCQPRRVRELLVWGGYIEKRWR